ALTLTSYQRDTLTELINVSMGKAADSLSRLLARKVVLRVPEVELMSTDVLKTFFREEVKTVGVMIRQRFTGVISGVAVMVFSSGVAERLLQTLIGLSGRDGLISGSQRAFLLEMGNIVLNAAISVLADFCRERLRVEMPILDMDMDWERALGRLLGVVGVNGAALVLVSRLSIGERELTGYLIIMLPEGEVLRLLERIS
ncbi:MAG: chemotaxis protein CheC, partial [Syntrophales bacterium]|nr:chemotaxis protein CheC [Syntrophales bacterium]